MENLNLVALINMGVRGGDMLAFLFGCGAASRNPHLSEKTICTVREGMSSEVWEKGGFRLIPVESTHPTSPTPNRQGFSRPGVVAR